jgi:hypothetical protein
MVGGPITGPAMKIGEIMRYAQFLTGVAVILALGLGGMARAQTEEPSAQVKLELEVNALSTLNDLNLTADQLSALKQMAADTAGTLAEKPAPISEDYVTALKDFRKALLSKDEDKIDEAEDAVGDLADKQDDDSDPDITQSDAAKSKAAGLVKLLTVKEFADYLSENADDMDDPTQLLLDAVHQCRGMSEDDFEDLRDDTSQELGIFAGGANPSKTPAIVGKVNSLLNKVHKMTDEEYWNQQSDLESEARKLTTTGDPMPSLRHWMENEMADLLANPELIHAIDEWTGAGKS